MLDGVLVGQYVPGQSFIHSLDARTKLVLTFAYVVLLFLIKESSGYAVAGAFTLMVTLAAQIPAALVLRGLRPIMWLLLITIVIHAFLTKGEGAQPLFALGPLVVTDLGVETGVLLGVRLALLVLTSSLMSLTTSPVELTDGLEQLLRPFQRVGVPAHEFAMMMTIALRFIPTLMEEAQVIMKAQMARGADFASGNIVRRARALVPILVPFFVGAFRRADDLALAMEARCYQGGEGRTRYKVSRLGWRDATACFVTALFTAAIFLLQKQGV